MHDKRYRDSSPHTSRTLRGVARELVPVAAARVPPVDRAAGVDSPDRAIDADRHPGQVSGELAPIVARGVVLVKDMGGGGGAGVPRELVDAIRHSLGKSTRPH